MKVVVIGDIFLDHYIYYDPEIGEPSLETMIKPIVAVKEHFSPGAAGNVAKNLSLLGLSTYIIGIIGNDGYGLELMDSLKNYNVNIDYIVQSKNRKTPVYTKFLNIKKDGKEDLARVDIVSFCTLGNEEEENLIKNIQIILEKVDLVIIEDQNDYPEFSTISRNVSIALLDLVNKHQNKIFIVDSRKRPQVFKQCYIKPNLNEFIILLKNAGISDEIETKNTPTEVLPQLFIREATRYIRKEVTVTAGEDGCFIMNQDKIFKIFAIKKEIKDVCGAGDAFLAAFAKTLLETNDLLLSGIEGTKAAAICVSQIETGKVTLSDLESEKEPEVIEILSNKIYINNIKKIENIKTVIFDFDGTISLLRRGWQSVMKEVMIENIIGNCRPSSEIYKKIEKEVEDFIEKSTGVQTIVQMQVLVKMIEKYQLIQKKDIKHAKDYKKIYNDKLIEIVNERIKKGKPEEYLIKGILDFLDLLERKGTKLILLSGTDKIDVERELKFLGVYEYFKDNIFGATENYTYSSKKSVIGKILANCSNLEEVVVCGDGPVEIALGKKFGTYTVGIASNEEEGRGWDVRKFNRLKKIGAHILIPDFLDIEPTLLITKKINIKKESCDANNIYGGECSH